jgi:hypothetical protein
MYISLMNSTLSTLHISIFTTILMMIIEGLIFFSGKARRHLHTFEFWAVLCFLLHRLLSDSRLWAKDRVHFLNLMDLENKNDYENSQ